MDIQSEVEQDELWEPSTADSDSLDLFFASVCQSTKRLPTKYQNQIKKQVLEVLLRVEEEHENENSLLETKTERTLGHS